MRIKELLKRGLFLVSVPKCVSCQQRLDYVDTALCPECLKEYNEHKKRNCSVCGKELFNCSCSSPYLESHYVKKLIKVYRYVYTERNAPNKMIYSLKRDNRSDVLRFLTGELKSAISASVKNPSECIFLSVPRRRKSIIKYGIDHAELLSRALAKEFSAEYRQPFVSKSKKIQKKLETSQRRLNANYKIKRNAKDLTGKTVILVDDIVTTGASMGNAAMLARALGAKTIIGAAISVAFKDKQTVFDSSDRFTPHYE